MGAKCLLTAIELTTNDSTYCWKPVLASEDYKRITLFTDADVTDKPFSVVRDRIWQVLNEVSPEVLAVPGWGAVSSILALEWCIKYKVPAVVMSDSQECDEPRKLWKEIIKSIVVKKFSAGFVAGKPHIDYLTKLGMKSSRIYVGYDVVDNEHFFAGIEKVKNTQNDKELIPDKYFLNCSRFIREKNLHKLIDAYAIYSASCQINSWHLVIVGDGELRSLLEARIAKLGLESKIHLPGFKQYDELPFYYGHACAYVQASIRDTWALAINEAMASGLPVLVSNMCGCAQDLVRDGVNGFTFDPQDTKLLAELMGKISSDVELRNKMGQASREIISNWTPEVFAENLLKAAKTAKETPPPKCSLLDRVLLRALCYR